MIYIVRNHKKDLYGLPEDQILHLEYENFVDIGDHEYINTGMFETESFISIGHLDQSLMDQWNKIIRAV